MQCSIRCVQKRCGTKNIYKKKKNFKTKRNLKQRKFSKKKKKMKKYCDSNPFKTIYYYYIEHYNIMIKKYMCVRDTCTCIYKYIYYKY